MLMLNNKKCIVNNNIIFQQLKKKKSVFKFDLICYKYITYTKQITCNMSFKPQCIHEPSWDYRIESGQKSLLIFRG